MNYHPEGIYVWDSWYFYHEGLTHCIHLQQLRPGSKQDKRESGALGHAVSQDMITWVSWPTALYPGELGSYDDCDLWTGCTIWHDNQFYLYYTARSTREKGTCNRIALATSTDGVHWVKHPENPVLSPNPMWYCGEDNPIKIYCHSWPIVDCRDLCVVRDPHGNGFWGFFAARKPGLECAETSVIGLCHSNDLVHWQQFPPCFEPRKYACVEVPEVFWLDGKWYMLCLTGNGYGQRSHFSDPETKFATIYAIADQIEGPYYELPDNILISSYNWQGYSSKTVEISGKRYLFYTQSEVMNGSNFGTIAVPKELKADADGHLHAYYYRGLDQYLEEILLDSKVDHAIPNHGQWGSIGQWQTEGDSICGRCVTDWALLVYEREGSHFSYSANITINSARSAGLAFRIQGDDVFKGAYVVLLDVEAGEVLFTKTRDFPRIEGRKWPIIRNRQYQLMITAIDAVINVYLDEILVLQMFHSGYAKGKFGLFVEQGSANFDNIKAMQINQKLELALSE